LVLAGAGAVHTAAVSIAPGLHRQHSPSTVQLFLWVLRPLLLLLLLLLYTAGFPIGQRRVLHD
jgi:hypothetical protein